MGATEKVSVDMNDSSNKLRFKHELLKINAPRMLAFSIVFVVLQVTTLFLSSNFSYLEYSVSSSDVYTNTEAWLAVKIITIVLGMISCVLFGLITTGTIKAPKAQNSLAQTTLFILAGAQLFVFSFELPSSYYLYHYLIFTLTLGTLPLLNRPQSVLFIVGFTLICWVPSMIFAPAETSSISFAPPGSVGSITDPSATVLYVEKSVMSGYAFVVAAVVFASLVASWLGYGQAKETILARLQAEAREEALNSANEENAADLREKAHAAEAANLAKTRFLTRVSHEMRTSMNTMSGMLFVAMETDDPASKKESLEAAEQASQKLKEIVNNIIDTTAIEMDFASDEASRDFDLLAADAALPSQAGAKVEAPDLSGHKILIVEDVETNRFVLREFLNSTRATVEEAADGKEAVELFAASPENHFSFIFMDLLMPEMNGHDATRAIRKMDRSDAATIPIVAVSANAFTEDIEASLAAGMDAHLSKPVEQSMIYQTLIERLV